MSMLQILEHDRERRDKLATDRARLRSALVALVGTDKKDELEAMEAALRALPIPDCDRAPNINAIRVLIETT